METDVANRAKTKLKPFAKQELKSYFCKPKEN